MTDQRLNIRKTDLAVITRIAVDAGEIQSKIAGLLLLQEERLKELREVLEEWRKPLA
ncbi:hypothetical protein [Bradyrhizobium sp. SK17]|uniref:hypothetical protein n=1 Tax=Bradyrhizobium sp. SK17 TaxID=2057741 RepID=UPI0012FD43DC|nr:hypothetical protein [Bradyrhizobium sp. SK17]